MSFCNLFMERPFCCVTLLNLNSSQLINVVFTHKLFIFLQVYLDLIIVHVTMR